MLNLYQIAATEETPLIDLNAHTGILVMKGSSISNESDTFYKPINKWIDEYVKTPQAVTQLIIKLDYFNISSSKYLLDILYKLKKLQENDLLVTVEWQYDKKEEDMLELGQDYEMMVRLPFKYVEQKPIKPELC